MSPEVKNFILDNISLIENDQWEDIYNNIQGFDLTGEFSKTLLEAKIDPLDYITFTPPNYLYNQTIGSRDWLKNLGSIKIINNRSFGGVKGLDSIELNKIELIQPSAFISSDVREIHINNPCHIRRLAFSNCIQLRELYLPNNFILETNAIYGCYGLCIVYDGTEQDWELIKPPYLDLNQYVRVKFLK